MTDTCRTIVAPSHVGLESRVAFRHAALEALGALPRDAGTLVIDMSLARFVDSAGLGTLIMVQQHAAGRGQTVRLRGVSEDIRLLLSLTKLEDLFVIDHGVPGKGMTAGENPLPFIPPESTSLGA